MASHGYRWIDYQHIDPKIEEEHIIKCYKSIKNILVENESPLSEKLWNRIKKIKNIIFPQTMLTITLVGTLYVFYFGYIASNANKTDIAYSWISLPLFTISYFHHIWTLKVKNHSFKLQIEVINRLPSKPGL